MVNGSKTFISGVREATKYGGGYVTVVKTSPELAHKGLSLCYLPVKDIPGITTNVFKQMGREGISTGAIIIKNVEIPSHYLIGDWNKGFYYAMEGFNCARPLVAAACIGAAEKALESGIEYIKRDGFLVRLWQNLRGCSFKWQRITQNLNPLDCLSIRPPGCLTRCIRKTGSVIKK